MAGRPLKFKSPEELQKKIDAYFDGLVKKQYYKIPVRRNDKNVPGEYDFKPEYDPDGNHVEKMEECPTITGLALWLGSDRSTLIDYESKYGDEFSHTIKGAKARIEYYTEIWDEAPPVKIFKLKNHGWVDKQEIEQNVTGFEVNIGYGTKDQD